MKLMAPPAEPISIKRYAKQRLYHADMGVYLTLDELAGMVEDAKDFIVYEAETGEDVTRSVLKQIIVECGTHG